MFTQYVSQLYLIAFIRPINATNDSSADIQRLSETSRRTWPITRRLEVGRVCFCDVASDSVTNAKNFHSERITLRRAAVSFARRFQTEAVRGPRGASWRRLAICSVCHMPPRVRKQASARALVFVNVVVGVRQCWCCLVYGLSSFSCFQLLFSLSLQTDPLQWTDDVYVLKKCMHVLCGVGCPIKTNVMVLKFRMKGRLHCYNYCYITNKLTFS